MCLCIGHMHMRFQSAVCELACSIIRMHTIDNRLSTSHANYRMGIKSIAYQTDPHHLWPQSIQAKAAPVWQSTVS